MIKLTLDSNILISGLFFKKGPPHKVLDLCMRDECLLVLSEDIVSEVIEVVNRKFSLPADQLIEFITLLRLHSRLVTPKEKISVIERDPDDNRILECAVAGSVNYVVSGDKDLLDLKEFRNIPIIKARAFLDILTPP